jgi:hypothetical protein
MTCAPFALATNRHQFVSRDLGQQFLFDVKEDRVRQNRDSMHYRHARRKHQLEHVMN